MNYYSKKLTNFRDFIAEDTSPGTYSSTFGNDSSYDGRLHPQISLDFPTVKKEGEVIKITVQGANYKIQINGGVTVFVPRKLYHSKYNRLPRSKTPNHPGDIVTAIYYKYKDRSEENYKLKSFQINQVR